jgi:hypothetical protein
VAIRHQVYAVLLLGCLTGSTGCLTLQSRYSLMDFGEAARAESSASWPILLAVGLGFIALGAATSWAIQRIRRSWATDPTSSCQLGAPIQPHDGGVASEEHCHRKSVKVTKHRCPAEQSLGPGRKSVSDRDIETCQREIQVSALRRLRGEITP